MALSHICSRTANCMFTLFPICGIHAELVHCLYSRRKAGNCEIQDPMPSTENVHGKATPQHRSYSLLLETGQKAGESVPSLSCSPQNYHKDNSSPLTQLLQLWFFARKFFPWCYFFSEVSSGSVAQLLSGRTPVQAASAFRLLIPALLVAVPVPLLLFFPFPDLILSLAKD